MAGNRRNIAGNGRKDPSHNNMGYDLQHAVFQYHVRIAEKPFGRIISRRAGIPAQTEISAWAENIPNGISRYGVLRVWFIACLHSSTLLNFMAH